MMREVRVDRLTWPEVETYLEHDDRAVLTIGAVEQHGPHLAMGTDSVTAEAVQRLRWQIRSSGGQVSWAPPWHSHWCERYN